MTTSARFFRFLVASPQAGPVLRTVPNARPRLVPLHTSAPRRAVWFLSPLVRLVVVIGARVSRTVWRRLPHQEKEAIKSAVRRRRRLWYTAGSIPLVGGVYFYYSHLETVPLTGRRRFMMYSREQVCDMITGEMENEATLRQLIGGRPLPLSHPLYEEVSGLFSDILRSNADWSPIVQETKWRLVLVDQTEHVNAVSLPTGHVIVYTGMLKECHNRDEVGLVLAHEVAHILLNHGVEELSHRGLLSFVGLFFIATIWLFSPTDFVSLVFHNLFSGAAKILVSNPHSRLTEMEADKVGLLLVSRSCLNPDSAVHLWTHLPMLNVNNRTLEYCQTHPANVRRHSALLTLLPAARDLFASSQCQAELGPEMAEFQKVMRKIKST